MHFHNVEDKEDRKHRHSHNVEDKDDRQHRHFHTEDKEDRQLRHFHERTKKRNNTFTFIMYRTKKTGNNALS